MDEGTTVAWARGRDRVGGSRQKTRHGVQTHTPELWEEADMSVAVAPVFFEPGDSLEFPPKKEGTKVQSSRSLGGREGGARFSESWRQLRDQEVDEAVYAETRAEVEDAKLLR